MSTLVLILAAASGCATTTKLAIAKTPPIDRTSPASCQPGFRSLMILPPKGSERGSIGEFISLEALFLRNNVQLISSAITGRVIQGTEDKAGQAAALSDVERALVLARGSNAEALLQIADLQADEYERYFEEDGGQLRATERLVPNKAGAALTELQYRFRARVIDVQSGSIVMLLDVSQNTTDTKEIRWLIDLAGKEVAQFSSVHDERRKAALDQVLSVVAEHMRPRPQTAGLSAQPCLASADR